MDSQTLINIIVALCGALGGWVLNSLRAEQIQHRQDLNELADKVHHIDVLVAGTYVKREELDKLAAAIFTKLDRIELKIDNKVDKK